MSDLEPLVVSCLERAVPLPSGARADWRDVLARAGGGERRAMRRRRWLLAVAAVAVVLGTAAAVTAALGGFDAWLAGSPGSPASPAAQRQFEDANGRSWTAFPTSTRLRMLIDTTVGGKRYVLYGFRSGKLLCLKLTAVSLAQATNPACAPVSTLEHGSAPIVIVESSDSFDDGYAHPAAQYSFGIAADGVSRVAVLATDGTHSALVGGNAYLWVEDEPNSANRVRSIAAVAANGVQVAIPVRPLGEFTMTATPPALGPSKIERTIPNPTIGWYVRHESRGLSPAQAHLTPLQLKGTHAPGDPAGFTRLVKPDPLLNIVVGLSGSSGGRRSDACLIVVDGGVGCDGSLSEFFTRGPLNIIYFGRGFNWSDQFIGVAGAAADGVAKVKIFLADGEVQTAALRDNLFAALVPIEPPFRVVAYDSDGHVVGVYTQPGIFFGAVRPSALRNLRPVSRVSGPNGATATLLIGNTVDHVSCYRVKFSTGQTDTACRPEIESGPSIDVDSVQPAGRDVFIYGQLRDAAKAELLFSNGETITATPNQGIFLFAIPQSQLSTQRQLAYAVALNSRGHEVNRQGVLYRSNQ